MKVKYLNMLPCIYSILMVAILDLFHLVIIPYTPNRSFDASTDNYNGNMS